MKRIMAMASGGGGNFRSICEYSAMSKNFLIERLIVDRTCGAKKVADDYAISVSELDFTLPAEFIAQELLRFQECDIIVLCGFNRALPAKFLKKIKCPVLNTHPSLLPKYGGKGMIGVKVQEAVIANQEEYAGCTIHFVDEGLDTGRIVLQASTKVLPGESPWDLGARIHQIEKKIYWQAINLVCDGVII